MSWQAKETEQYREELASAYTDIRKKEEWNSLGLNELNEIAQEAIEKAEYYHNKKRYKDFGVYLGLYVDIWHQAHENLTPEDYMNFCLLQYVPARQNLQ